MTELPKTFDPAEIESRWYAHWEAEGLFAPERPDAMADARALDPEAALARLG